MNRMLVYEWGEYGYRFDVREEQSEYSTQYHISFIGPTLPVNEHIKIPLIFTMQGDEVTNTGYKTETGQGIIKQIWDAVNSELNLPPSKFIDGGIIDQP